MKFLTNLTLWKKITLLTALGLALGVAVFSSLGMRAVNQATETMLEDRLTTARLLADHIDEALAQALAQLENTAETIEINGTKAHLDSQAQALEDAYSRLSVYTYGIYLLNESGQIVYSKPEVPASQYTNISSIPGVSQTIITGKAGISGLASAPLTDHPVIFLASPVSGQAENRATLVVAVDISQSSIGGFVKPLRLGQSGYVEIVDQNGIVVARTEPGPKLAPFEKSDHSGRFAALISAGKPTRGVCHTCHEPEQKVQERDVLAFVPLSQASWGVVIRQSESEALAPIGELNKSLLLFGVVLVTIALLFVLITTRDMGSRIKMLTIASSRIAEGDLISHVPSAGNDEVGVLARTFDDMRVKLKISYNDLEQKTKELSSLLSVSEILTTTFDLSNLLDAVVAKAVEVISGADGGALLLQSPEEKLVVQCAFGLNKEELPQSLSPDSSSGNGHDIINEGVNAFLQSEALRSRIRSSISADIVHHGKRIGSLIMVSLKSTQAFSESDRRLLQAIADYIAIATERAQLTKEAEQARALREADRLKSEFISSVSHELRTPLTLIKGYSTSLLREDASWDKEAQQEFLQIIDGKTDELRDMIDKLLQSAKLEAGALKLEKEPVLLSRLARKVVEDTELRAKKHKFRLEFASSFPVVEADMRCMEQVLRNLVQNAVKYSPQGGEVVISGKVNDGKVLVSVSDEGVGIPPEHLDKLFQRFYRVDSPMTRGIPGSGLGLSITKGHIEAHGGQIWVESKVGKGSKFQFSLPLEQNGRNE